MVLIVEVSSSFANCQTFRHDSISLCAWHGWLIVVIYRAVVLPILSRLLVRVIDGPYCPDIALMNASITFLRGGVFNSGAQRMFVIQLDGTIIKSLDFITLSNSSAFSGEDAYFQLGISTCK